MSLIFLFWWILPLLAETKAFISHSVDNKSRNGRKRSRSPGPSSDNKQSGSLPTDYENGAWAHGINFGVSIYTSSYHYFEICSKILCSTIIDLLRTSAATDGWHEVSIETPILTLGLVYEKDVAFVCGVDLEFESEIGFFSLPSSVRFLWNDSSFVVYCYLQSPCTRG